MWKNNHISRFLLGLCSPLLLICCNTNPPVFPPLPEVRFGRLYVSANVDSATIYLDDSITGKVTPDTITVSAGTHLIRLEKQGLIPASTTVIVVANSLTAVHLALETTTAAKVVLLEDFSNVSCIPCVSSNAILRALAGGTYGRGQVVALRYATNFPSPQDPFYVAAQTLCDSRMSYYHILFAPTLIVDGTRRPTPTDSLAIKGMINASLAESPKFSLTVTKSILGDLYATEVIVRVLDTTGIEYNSVVLHTAIVESEVSFTSPPGANGETSFRDVVRAMLPSSSGELLSVIPPGSQAAYQRQVVVGTGWSVHKLTTVAFLQHRQSKVVYQAGSAF